MIEDVLGKLVADKYRIESLIRESESGDLFAGRHEVLEKRVTVKVLSRALAIDARWVKLFVDEARAASSISHPNVLNITDFGTDARGTSYSVFEPVDGTTLAGITSNEEALEPKRALEIARQIAASVSAAHEKQQIHGRLEPNNIFLNEGDNVKVYGFGSDPMKVARDADPRYLAPEQCGAFPAADERSDVYSLGVLLYKMLSGVVPYDAATPAEILEKQNTEPPAPLSAFQPDLHPEIEPIILTAIAADPERRYQTMEAFAEDLDTLAGRLGVPVKTAAAAAGGAPKRNIWQTAFIVLAGIGVLAAAFIYATSVRKSDPTANLQSDAASLPVQPIGPASGSYEDSLARQRPLTPDELSMAAAANTAVPLDMVPGGDGYNAWANGGSPPIGAPPPSNQSPAIPPLGYVPPPGQTVTIPEQTETTTVGVMYDAENNRCFQGTTLVRCPWLGPMNQRRRVPRQLNRTPMLMPL